MILLAYKRLRLIVRAGLASGCIRIYSEDLKSGWRIDGLTVINPFT
jgi:predicted nucleic acid-binding protein